MLCSSLRFFELSVFRGVEERAPGEVICRRTHGSDLELTPKFAVAAVVLGTCVGLEAAAQGPADYYI